jgi:mannosylglucosylglycerate synthase
MTANNPPSIAILHYTAPPVVGGVEAVLAAQCRLFMEAGYRVAIVSGRGDSRALPAGTEFLPVLEIDSQHPEIARLNPELEAGDIPVDFDRMVKNLHDSLAPILSIFDNVIVHNIFTKHFNLPLTAALFRMLDEGTLPGCIAWCHDFTWTSPNSRSKVHPGYPWELLRTYREDITYVTISQERRAEMAEMFGCQADQIRVIYNGVDPKVQLGLSQAGWELAQRLGLLEGDLNLLMPVRVTHAKNIELALKVTAAIKAQGVSPRLVLTGPPDPHDAHSMDYFRKLQSQRNQLNLRKEMRFVFESGPKPDEPYTIEPEQVGDLYRLCDMLFMPSHREGFGMPILEAGLAGLKIVSTGIPASRELAQNEVMIIDARGDPQEIAQKIVEWAQGSSIQRLRRSVRQNYTWPALFRGQIEPLLKRTNT